MPRDSMQIRPHYQKKKNLKKKATDIVEGVRAIFDTLHGVSLPPYFIDHSAGRWSHHVCSLFHMPGGNEGRDAAVVLSSDIAAMVPGLI